MDVNFQMQYFKEHTQFGQQNFCELGVYDYYMAPSKSSTTTIINKNGFRGRGVPYDREPYMYNPEFCKDDFVRKTYLRTLSTKQKLIYIFIYIYIYIYIYLFTLNWVNKAEYI